MKNTKSKGTWPDVSRIMRKLGFNPVAGIVETGKAAEVRSPIPL